MKLGVLGGSFDPVHKGHLRIARAALLKGGLDRVLLMVAGAPPHKRGRRLAPAHHRLTMARRAVADLPGVFVDDREVRREGLSYTLDTLRDLLAGDPPPDSLSWIIGADSLPELPTWHRHEEVVGLARFLTVPRPGFDIENALGELREHYPPDVIAALRSGVLRMEPVDLSSTDIRRRVRGGLSVRRQVPDVVADYIRRHGLYAR